MSPFKSVGNAEKKFLVQAATPEESWPAEMKLAQVVQGEAEYATLAAEEDGPVARFLEGFTSGRKKRQI